MRIPKPQERITMDGVPIVEGMRAYNYYDCVWGIVQPEGPYSEGWFDILADDGSKTYVDGSRMSSKKPLYKEGRLIGWENFDGSPA